jgi:hypothetical protein
MSYTKLIFPKAPESWNEIFKRAQQRLQEMYQAIKNGDWHKPMDLVRKIVDNLDESATLGIKSGDVPGTTFKILRTMLDRAMNPTASHPHA